ncbi:hypothetical protein PG993_003593 [Apiospora rasikravindrae]|uniref:Uncharacterized protein n=1 Tax=Apiospora rasikravindrae TaxID=990691 RepID=A0ABR1U069_9PEZI
MDWERTDSHWTNHDFSRFTYDTGELVVPASATIVSRLGSNGHEFHVETLSSPGAWKLWFDRTDLSKDSGLCVIIYNKAQDSFGGDGFESLMSLPVTRNTFAETVQRFQIQPCITRTIMREKGLSLSIVFGCKEEAKQQLITKLKRVDRAHYHPMIMAGIFFELERARLEECVDQLTDDFALNSSEIRPLDLNMGSTEMVGYLQKCYRSRELGSEINSLKRQLKKVIDETAMFDETYGAVVEKDKSSEAYEAKEGHDYQHVKFAGRRIRSRVEEMCDILDDKIDSCNVTIDNMSLTMQTLWNHFAQEDNKLNTSFNRTNTRLSNTNKEISQSMQDDSTQMKFIALLTMVFLPISTMTSIFSTELFSWDAGPGEAVISKYLWVFIVISLALTTVVVGAWGIATRYAFLRRKKADEDSKDYGKFG